MHSVLRRPLTLGGNWYCHASRRSLSPCDRGDLKFTPDGALQGMIRKNKTDQYGKGRLVFGTERIARLIQPVFCAINHGKCENWPYATEM